MRLQLRSSLVKPAKKVIGKQRLTVLVNVSFPAPMPVFRLFSGGFGQGIGGIAEDPGRSSGGIRKKANGLRSMKD